MEHSKKSEFWKYVMLGLAVLLLVVSAVQAYEIAGVAGDKAASGNDVKGYPEDSDVSAVAYGGQQQAQAMVGGC